MISHSWQTKARAYLVTIISFREAVEDADADALFSFGLKFRRAAKLAGKTAITASLITTTRCFVAAKS